MNVAIKGMLDECIGIIRAKADDDEAFRLAVNVFFHDFAVELGALMVEIADGTARTCPLHKVGHFVCSMTMSVTAALQDGLDIDKPEPAPEPEPAPKQTQLVLVPITPSPAPAPEAPPTPRFISPAEIKPLRKAKGWSQVQLGQVVGLSAGTISRWERGDPRFEPSVRECLTMQAALGWTG